MATISGPVVLAARSYGGMVITNAATGNANVDGYIKKDAFRDVFAGDVPSATTDLMWAGQRPADARALWRTVRRSGLEDDPRLVSGGPQRPGPAGRGGRPHRACRALSRLSTVWAGFALTTSGLLLYTATFSRRL